MDECHIIYLEELKCWVTWVVYLSNFIWDNSSFQYIGSFIMIVQGQWVSALKM